VYKIYTQNFQNPVQPYSKNLSLKSVWAIFSCLYYQINIFFPKTTHKITYSVIYLATEILGQKKSEKMNNIKLILGAGGGVLVLTSFIILFIVLRRKRNKKIEKAKQRETSAAREDENLIPNPIFSNNGKEAVDTKPGVETLHYPRDSIEHTETLENGMQMSLCSRKSVAS
jgi:hypothetical protein